MTRATLLTLICAASAAIVSAQDFSAKDLKYCVDIRNGATTVRVHRNYPVLSFGNGLNFTWSPMPGTKPESLKISKRDETEIQVCWTAVPGKNAEQAKVAAEFVVTVRKDFPGIFVESRVYNKDFIGDLKCAQRWGLPGFKKESYPSDNGVLKIGTAWKKMTPIKYFLYEDEKGSVGFITDGLEKGNRSMFTNFSITDFPAKKIGLWLGLNFGQVQENECSKIKFVLVPAKDIEELKKQYDQLLQQKELETLWKY